MHEHGLMKNLMRRVVEAAQNGGAERVVGVSVWLGALCHMSPDHFREHFDQAAAGTPAEGAKLDITASDDIGHPDAADVMIAGIEVEADAWP